MIAFAFLLHVLLILWLRWFFIEEERFESSCLFPTGHAQVREYHAQGGGVPCGHVHGPTRLADHLAIEHVLFIAHAQVREYHAQGGAVGH